MNSTHAQRRQRKRRRRSQKQLRQRTQQRQRNGTKRVSANRARQRTRRTCASVPRWSTCARARPTVTHASARARKQANSQEETQQAIKATQAVTGIWPKTKTDLCKAKTADRNIRSTIARFWAQVRDRSGGGDKDPQLGVCADYGGTRSDKGFLEYATQNTTEVFWMKALLDADDALLEAEHALAAANRTLDDVTRLSENAQDKHEALVAALTRENGAQARDADEAPQSAGASAETATTGDAERDSRKATRKDTTGKASTAETQSSTDSAHFGWLGVQLATGMTTFAGRHAEH
ncbi:hypothetical protein, conserved in T. vivax [Trypanosoma vivax Y486]|uniref:Uncharacterized protein n=1 Tax=Trypanosoma vivax (strain Y486) TaxID=1055687 RepID=F9WTZ3_TRYVY|nr:hypothetical protein, conserved in T. vivax [Trypanosoma vivax Y486]|eukprot:CCD21039.1 hypothetical protein, conserved in T. vivax [Trypanosoma vivax Y486]